jgi:predicted alpha/beta hydrolase
MTFYARLCGATLARAHARSGDPIAIAAYLGPGDDIDQAIAKFSTQYADQNNQDYQAFVQATKDGRIDAVQGV